MPQNNFSSFARALPALLLALTLPLLAACESLNAFGVGGEPELLCHRRTGQARIDDKLLGPQAAHISVVRRFRDADELCAAPAAKALSSLKAAQ